MTASPGAPADALGKAERITMSQSARVSQPTSATSLAPRLGTFAATYRPWLVALAALVVFALSAILNFNQIRQSPFHPDESRWINRAAYISELQHPRGIFWGDGYLVRGQPPFGSYITGLGLLIQGRDTDTNAPWDFHFGNESVINWEAGHNAVPSQDDLLAARRTNAVIGALTAALIVVILAQFTNLLGAFIGGAFIAMNTLQEYLSSTALSDATLGLILVLSTLTAMQLVRKPSWLWTLVLGGLLGCGMAAKLSPIALAAGFAGIGVAFLLRKPLMRIPGISRLVSYLAHGREASIDRLGWMLVSLPFIAFSTFVALYPYVWSAPISRTRGLFDFRSQEMKSQGRIWPDRKIDGPLDALDRLWHTFQEDYPTTGKIFAKLAQHTPFPEGVPSLDIGIVACGLVLAIVVVIRKGIATPMAFAFFLLGGQAAAIVVGLKVDFNRYYLPILIFLAICFGYAGGEAFTVVSEEIRRFRANRSRQVVPTALPLHDKP
jgi:hypothetical protein